MTIFLTQFGSTGVLCLFLLFFLPIYLLIFCAYAYGYLFQEIQQSQMQAGLPQENNQNFHC